MHVLGVLALVLTAATEPVEVRFSELCSSTPERYAGTRAEVLAAPHARALLEDLAVEGGTAHERALAGALLRRLRAPEVAARLDGWAPSKAARLKRNPAPYEDRELVGAYGAEHELAYERLFADRGPRRSEALLSVVAASPRDAFDRLLFLLARHVHAARHLAELDPQRAVTPLLGAMERTTNSDDIRVLIRALKHTGTRRPDVLAALRGLLREGPCRYEAAETLGEMKDRESVEHLVPLLGDLETCNAAFEALGMILGRAERDLRLALLAAASESEHRRWAAVALHLGERDPRSRSELLARLATDPEETVRLEALSSLWRMARRVQGRLSPRVEPALARALQSPSLKERETAASALGALVPDGLPPTLAVQRAALRALTDREGSVSTTVLVNVDAIFGKDGAPVVLLLDALGLASKRWPADEIVARARQRLPDPGPRIRALGGSRLPQIRSLVRQWKEKHD